jgi:hypothetical protein
MSNPRYTDPYRGDPSGRGSDQTGIWPWLTAALTALGLLIGGLFGYNWGVEHERVAQSSPPATTGSAPAQHAPGTR